ncbi:MAG: cupin domain-containing protein [Sedimentisphaerales bacterium]|nr:cupin domain-containing protein [Sedimentisphaerales bacterium]
MKPKPFALEIEDTKEFQRLLDKNTQSYGMKAGKVYLEPGESCGLHSTSQNEEMLIFLSGTGTALIEGSEPLPAGVGKIAYIPPQTQHDIKNTGNDPLIYIYCVAPAGQKDA